MNTDSLKQATDTAFTAFLDATQATEGKQAYLYGLPHAIGCWSLTLSGGPDDGAFSCVDIGSMRMNASLDGRFRTLEEAQVTAMQLCGATPVRAEGKVTMLRITAPPTIKLEGFTPFQSDGPVGVYTIQIPLEMVLDCSEG